MSTRHGSTTNYANIRDAVLEQTKNATVPAAQIRDLRDMITLCRTLDLKPEKGRRKDLQKDRYPGGRTPFDGPELVVDKSHRPDLPESPSLPKRKPSHYRRRFQKGHGSFLDRHRRLLPGTCNI